MRTKIKVVIVALIFFINPLNSIITSPKNINRPNLMDIDYTPVISDVAGTDLYAESIDAFISGNKSVIKQSLFSNDTNILPQFDTRDPAFFKCSVLISTSNGIVPAMFPRIITENNLDYQYSMTFNPFCGFLYYDEQIPPNEANLRAQRALEIIKRKFQIDLILINTSHSNLFPFIGHYPDWTIYFNEILPNLPQDGYWKALDVERLTSQDYISQYHLSSTFFLINSIDFFESDVLDDIKQVNFNMDSLDLSYLESLEVDTLFGDLTNVIEDYSSLYGNLSDLFPTDFNSTLQGLGEALGSFTLSNQSHYFNLMIQYEGKPEGIKSEGNDTYAFNLWDAMGYKGEALRPSDKIFIALIGAFMSRINVKILSSDIISVSPSIQTLYDFLIEQIGSLLFYANIDFDIQTLRDYSFKTIWMDNSGIKEAYSLPFNFNSSNDYINFLPLFGFEGVSGIYSGLFNPLNDLIIKYKMSDLEANMKITKEMIGENTSYGATRNFDFNITATNVGDNVLWGVPTHIPYSLDDIFTLIAGPFGNDLLEAIWEVVRVEYRNEYSSIEDFFNFDKDPRVFYFDTAGVGLIDTYFPDILNFSNLVPFNERMENVVDILASGYPQLINALQVIGINTQDLKDLFMNPNSIWNDENWRLNPEEHISYLFSNFSISAFDTYSVFYVNDFMINHEFPELPSIIAGVSLNETSPEMALADDNASWIIGSEQKFVDNYFIDIDFLFQNQTKIDLQNNSLDRISIIIDFQDYQNNLEIEVFNFSEGTFQDISSYLESSINNTNTYEFFSSNDDFDWIFDPESRENHSIVLKVKASSNEEFNISINNLDVEFAYRDVNEYKVLGSRVIYSTENGLIRYIRRSNSISLSTHNMCSIIVNSYMNDYNFIAGDTGEFHLIIRNVGVEEAHNVSISILIPGIINNPGNFSINENHLEYTLSQLMENHTIILNFSFFIPNSALISSVNVSYENQEIIQNINATKLVANSNDVFYHANIDYIDDFPYKRIIAFDLNASDLTPSIGEFFNLTIICQNLSPETLNISRFQLYLDNQYGDLSFQGTKHLAFQEIESNDYYQIKTLILKSDWKGYYIPPINFIESNQTREVEVMSSSYRILGAINLTITKSVDKDQVQIGDHVGVTINVTNTGSICIKILNLNDMISFNQLEFDLIEGNLINEIGCLMPGEYATFSYTIEAKGQNLVKLKPAFIDYYFLRKTTQYSNEITVKIIIPKLVQLFIITIPLSLALVSMIWYIIRIQKYRAKKVKQQREELHLFNVLSVNELIKVERTLNEELHDFNKRMGEGI